VRLPADCVGSFLFLLIFKNTKNTKRFIVGIFLEAKKPA